MGHRVRGCEWCCALVGDSAHRGSMVSAVRWGSGVRSDGVPRGVCGSGNTSCYSLITMSLSELWG